MGFQNKIVKVKKSLGQNFFANKNLAQKIVKIVQDENPDVIVEIGPGRGAFSQYMVKKYNNTILIEKDNLLSKQLKERFPSSRILNVDFLKWNFTELEDFKKEKILFFGSLPYNVSKKIIKKIIKSSYFNTSCYFIIQKEVALKYTSKEPDNNLLAVTTNIYADTKRIFDISGESFKPKPKVESSFIKITPSKLRADVNREALEKFLKSCFKQPRKTLNNNLKDNYKFKNSNSEAFLKKKSPTSVLK